MFRFYFTITELVVKHKQASLVVPNTCRVCSALTPTGPALTLQKGLKHYEFISLNCADNCKMKKECKLPQQLSDPAAGFLSVCFRLDVYRMWQRLLSISPKTFCYFKMEQ